MGGPRPPTRAAVRSSPARSSACRRCRSSASCSLMEGVDGPPAVGRRSGPRRRRTGRDVRSRAPGRRAPTPPARRRERPALAFERRPPARRPSRAPRGTARRSRPARSATSVAREFGSIGRAHPFGVELEVRDERRHRRQRECERVERVEHRLLVLLEVAVVGERQALHRRRQRDEVAEQPSGLAARQLGDVGVPLLRHHARPGAVAVGQLRRTRTPRWPTAPRPRRGATGARRGSSTPTGTRARSRGRTPHRSSCRTSARTRAARPSSPIGRSRVEPASAPAPSAQTSADARAAANRAASRASGERVRQEVVGELTPAAPAGGG